MVVGKTQIWHTGILNCLYPRVMIQGGEYITLRTFFFFGCTRNSGRWEVLGWCFRHWDTGVLDSCHIWDSHAEQRVALLAALPLQERNNSTCKEKQREAGSQSP